MKTKELANEIVDAGMDYALEQEKDPRKRIKAYRKAATEFYLLAGQIEWELDSKELLGENRA